MLTQFIQPLIRQTWVRCAIGLAFAVHPIHCEAVASCVGRAELGMAFHILLALITYQRHIQFRSNAEQTSSRCSLTQVETFTISLYELVYWY